MTRTFKYFTIPLAFLALGFCAGLYWNHDPQIAKIRHVHQFIADHYHRPVDGKSLYDGAIEGMLQRLDRYCAYFTAEESKSVWEKLEGRFGGVGIVVQFDESDHSLKVIRTVDGSPAFQSGILPGDKILAVDGKPITKQTTMDQVVFKMIRGVPGSPVKLKVWRKDVAPRDVTLIRAKIETPTVHATTLDRSVGYIRVTEFSDNTPDLFDGSYARLQKEGIKGLIVDMRFNPGGSLKAALDLSSRFVPAGAMIVTTRGRSPEQVVELRSTAKGPSVQVPVVVLVNEFSASASEVFTGALQDHKIATIVGSRTYGKGSVQSIEGLPDGSAFKITTARYYTPSGRDIHKVDEEQKEYGILPDRVISLTPEEALTLAQNFEKDPKPEGFVDKQLEEARTVLTSILDKKK